MKKIKPGERFNAFQKKKKSYSEADMGSMKGYDPTGGLGNKGYAKATAVPKQTIKKSAPLKGNYGKTVSPIKFIGGGAANQIPGNATPRTSTQSTAKTPNIQYKKHSKKAKHKKGHSAAAIKGIKKFVAEESKEKTHKKHRKSTMKCKMCGK